MCIATHPPIACVARGRRRHHDGTRAYVRRKLQRIEQALLRFRMLARGVLAMVSQPKQRQQQIDAALIPDQFDEVTC